MPRPWRIRFAGAKYHLTQRGNGAQAVFLSEKDYGRFIEQLDHCLDKNEVVLYAYCLMPNHYHLFVETPLGNVQRFMQTLNTAYAMYFRYKHNSPGHCWQGRYGAQLVKGDDYIRKLTRYIHLNPVKMKGWPGRPVEAILKHLNGWEWSSYRGYVGLAAPEERIDYRWLSLMQRRTDGGRRKECRRYVERRACQDDEDFLKDLAASSYAVGDETYREEVKNEIKEKKLERAVTGDVKWPEDRLPGIEMIEQAVLKEFGVKTEDLHCHGRHAGVVKSIAVELSCRLSGKSQREVGSYYGYGGDGGVSKQRQRLASRMAGDRMLSTRVDRLTRAVSKYIVQV